MQNNYILIILQTAVPCVVSSKYGWQFWRGRVDCWVNHQHSGWEFGTLYQPIVSVYGNLAMRLNNPSELCDSSNQYIVRVWPFLVVQDAYNLSKMWFKHEKCAMLKSWRSNVMWLLHISSPNLNECCITGFLLYTSGECTQFLPLQAWRRSEYPSRLQSYWGHILTSTAAVQSSSGT